MQTYKGDGLIVPRLDYHIPGFDYTDSSIFYACSLHLLPTQIFWEVAVSQQGQF